MIKPTNKIFQILRVNQGSLHAYNLAEMYGIAPGGKESYVNQLNNSMSRDPHVRASLGQVKGAEYRMIIDVRKQDAIKYETQLVVPLRPAAVSRHRPGVPRSLPSPPVSI